MTALTPLAHSPFRTHARNAARHRNRVRSRWMTWSPRQSAEAPVAGLRLVHLALSDEKRFELNALTVRHKTAEA